MKIFVVAIFVAILFQHSGMALADTSTKVSPAKGILKTALVKEITFENREVNGVKTWLPAEVKVRKGDAVKITAKNTLDAPHGFEIPGYVEQDTILPKTTKVYEFSAAKTGVFPVRCHLHPAHVGAKLIVE